MQSEIIVTVNIHIDINNLHDVLTELVDVDKITTPYIIERFNRLPNRIKATALAWGTSDTEFRDEMYLFYKLNKHLL